MAETIHGTAVRYCGLGLLIRGPSGSGKSLLAASLLLRGGVLVGDDRLRIEAREGRLHAAPVPPLEGLIEIRGRGIVAVAHEPSAPIGGVVDIVASAGLERFPEEGDLVTEILGVTLRRQPVPDRLEHALILVDVLCGRLDGADHASEKGLRSARV